MRDHELRFSDTNSADDSIGRTWGLDGNLFWFVVAGVFLFVVTLLLLFSALRCSFGQSFGIALIPLGLTLIYVFGFRQGNGRADEGGIIGEGNRDQERDQLDEQRSILREQFA